MGNIYTQKEIKKAKEAMRRDTRFSHKEREESTASLDKLVGARKGGSKSKRIIKGSGLALSDRRGVEDILGGESRKSPIPPKMDQPSVPSSKPKTSWWKAVSSPFSGGSKPQGGGNQPSNPRVGSSKNYDKLRQQFGGTKVGYTDRSGSSSTKPPRRSLFGLRKLH